MQAKSRGEAYGSESLPKVEDNKRIQNNKWMKMAQLGAALLMAICMPHLAAAQDVHYNSMPGTDFSKYHTYKWIEIEGASHPNSIVDAEIKQAVDSQLAYKSSI